MRMAAKPSQEGARLTVAEAAALLGRSSQMVRNYVLKSGVLKGGRIEGSDALWIDEQSVNDLAPTLNANRGGSRTATGQGNGVFRFANLRLLEINERYAKALRAELDASELERAASAIRRQAATELLAAGDEFRELVTQFHIPDDVARA